MMFYVRWWQFLHEINDFGCYSACDSKFLLRAMILRSIFCYHVLFRFEFSPHILKWCCGADDSKHRTKKVILFTSRKHFEFLRRFSEYESKGEKCEILRPLFKRKLNDDYSRPYSLSHNFYCKYFYIFRQWRQISRNIDHNFTLECTSANRCEIECDSKNYQRLQLRVDHVNDCLILGNDDNKFLTRHFDI